MPDAGQQQELTDQQKTDRVAAVYVLQVLLGNVPGVTLEKTADGIAVEVRRPRRPVNRKPTIALANPERYSTSAIAWREAVFARDDYTCQKCGLRGANLNAHHLKGWAEEPEERLNLENGLTLCTECHALRHPQQAALIRKARYFRV